MIGTGRQVARQIAYFVCRRVAVVLANRALRNEAGAPAAKQIAKSLAPSLPSFVQHFSRAPPS
jgi:hypothetical protein